jgi:hypothetical protein
MTVEEAQKIAFDRCAGCPVKCEPTGKMVSVQGYCVPKILEHSNTKTYREMDSREMERRQANFDKLLALLKYLNGK